MSSLVLFRMARALLVLAIAVVTSVAVVPPAQTDPTGEIYTQFYDCALNLVGWRFRGCGATGWSAGVGGQEGQQSGAWKSIETSPCENGGTYSYSWYRWTGSTWVRESAPYCTCC